jgi:two-component system, sensor histidine kinase and response regulator
LIEGRIWLQSAVGTGSTFYFTAWFNLHDLNEAETVSREAVDVKGLPILVVDDNPINLRVFSEILNHWGMLTTTASSGQAAIDAMIQMAESGGSYLMILLDAMMPIMDGFMVAKMIREDSRFNAVTIMMLSSADRPEDLDRCRELGINLYVCKPVKHSEFWNAIQMALGSSASVRIDSLRSILPKPAKLLKILLAEDNIINQHMAVVLLEERGHHVQVAVNGQEVLSMLANSSYDLILMDVQMPVMDGFQATQAIRIQEQSSGQHMRIVAMTAHALKGDRERCLAAGMDDYISKPVQEEELLAVVENWNTIETGLIEVNQVGQKPEPIMMKPMLDWETALNRVRGKQKLLNKMMSLFLEQSTQSLPDLERALDQQDAKQLQICAHTLKSSANSIGAFELGEIAQQLESQAQNLVIEEARASFGLLTMTLNQLKPQISAYLSSHPAD